MTVTLEGALSQEKVRRKVGNHHRHTQATRFWLPLNSLTNGSAKICRLIGGSNEITAKVWMCLKDVLAKYCHRFASRGERTLHEFLVPKLLLRD